MQQSVIQFVTVWTSLMPWPSIKWYTDLPSQHDIHRYYKVRMQQFVNMDCQSARFRKYLVKPSSAANWHHKGEGTWLPSAKKNNLRFAVELVHWKAPLIAARRNEEKPNQKGQRKENMEKRCYSVQCCTKVQCPRAHHNLPWQRKKWAKGDYSRFLANVELVT